MTLEYGRFETDDSEALVTERDALVAHLRKRYGTEVVSANLVRYEDASIGDVILWATRETAVRAAEEMTSDPAAAGFFGLITKVHEMRHAELLHSA